VGVAQEAVAIGRSARTAKDLDQPVDRVTMLQATG
jgi:hypothetical protein